MIITRNKEPDPKYAGKPEFKLVVSGSVPELVDIDTLIESGIVDEETAKQYKNTFTSTSASSAANAGGFTTPAAQQALINAGFQPQIAVITLKGEDLNDQTGDLTDIARKNLENEVNAGDTLHHYKGAYKSAALAVMRVADKLGAKNILEIRNLVGEMGIKFGRPEQLDKPEVQNQIALHCKNGNAKAVLEILGGVEGEFEDIHILRAAFVQAAMNNADEIQFVSDGGEYVLEVALESNPSLKDIPAVANGHVSTREEMPDAVVGAQHIPLIDSEVDPLIDRLKKDDSLKFLVSGYGVVVLNLFDQLKALSQLNKDIESDVELVVYSGETRVDQGHYAPAIRDRVPEEYQQALLDGQDALEVLRSAAEDMGIKITIKDYKTGVDYDDRHDANKLNATAARLNIWKESRNAYAFLIPCSGSGFNASLTSIESSGDVVSHWLPGEGSGVKEGNLREAAFGVPVYVPETAGPVANVHKYDNNRWFANVAKYGDLMTIYTDPENFSQEVRDDIRSRRYFLATGNMIIRNGMRKAQEGIINTMSSKAIVEQELGTEPGQAPELQHRL